MYTRSFVLTGFAIALSPSPHSANESIAVSLPLQTFAAIVLVVLATKKTTLFFSHSFFEKKPWPPLLPS
jgi:hypothetical protein